MLAGRLTRDSADNGRTRTRQRAAGAKLARGSQARQDKAGPEAEAEVEAEVGAKVAAG